MGFAKKKHFLSCSLQDRSLLLCKLHDSNSLSSNFQDSSTLSCNLQDSSFLSCNLQDRNFLLYNLHDMSFLIGNLIHRDIVEPRLKFRRSYSWWFRDLACGGLIGSNGIDSVHVPLGLVWGEGMVWLRVCVDCSDHLISSGRKTEGLVWYFCSLRHFNCWWWLVAWCKR